MLVDLSFALVTHFQVLRSQIPSGAPQGVGRNAAEDVKELLLHGAEYLLACHDPGTNSVVSHVYTDLPGIGGEWVRPEDVRTYPTDVTDALLCYCASMQRALFVDYYLHLMSR
jgi:hypothetical protein